MINIASLLHSISVWALPLIFAVTFHEAAHGYVAKALGDDTAQREGRISLNPVRHIDPVGTLLLPAVLLMLGSFLFGWAKPVPVNYMKLKSPRWGMVAVAIAGPASNVAMALVAILLIRWVSYLPASAVDWARLNLANAITINLILAVFNMIPIPPLDGGRVAVGVLPKKPAMMLARLENVGMLLLLTALILLPMAGRALGVYLDPFGLLMAGPASWLLQALIFLTGGN